MLGGVEAGFRHLAGQRHADRIAHALAEGTGGALHSRGFVELRVAGGLRMQGAEILYLFQREVVAAEVQPRVEEHRAVPGREDETVAIQPTRFVGVVDQGVAVKDSADFSRAQGKTQVPGGRFVDRVHGETTGLSCRFGKNVGLQFHVSEWRVLVASRAAREEQD